MPGAFKYAGPLTGVKVWGSGIIRMLQRRRHIAVEDELNDVVKEREAEETDDEEEESSVRPVNVLSCPKYMKWYRHEEYFEKQVENCGGKNEDSYAIKSSIGISIDMLMTGEAQRYERGRKEPG